MRKILFGCFLLALVCSCQDSGAPDYSGKPESDIDAARMFIRSALDGNYKRARTLIAPDSSNLQLLDNIERSYLKWDVSEQRGYRESTIRTYDTRRLSDSASVIVYANSFKNQKDSIKAVRINGDWLIDLKYSFPQTQIPQ